MDDMVLILVLQRSGFILQQVGLLKGWLTKKWHFVAIYSPWCCFKPVWVSFICWKKIFWRMLLTKLVANVFQSIFTLLWKSRATSNSLVTNILQNIFCNRRKKLKKVCNKLMVSKWWQNFHFWVNYDEPLMSLKLSCKLWCISEWNGLLKKKERSRKQNGDMFLQIGSRLDWGRFECELAVNCMIGEIQNMKIK